MKKEKKAAENAAMKMYHYMGLHELEKHGSEEDTEDID